MAGRIIKYSEQPMPFHKTMGTRKLVIMKRIGYDDETKDTVAELLKRRHTPAVARIAKPKNPTKAKVRLADNVAIDDEDGEVAEAKKGTMSMTDFEKIIRDHESLVLDFAKRQVDGERTGLEKHDYFAAIEHRAAKLRADGESPQQAFSKTITDDEIGKLLFKALKRAPGSEVVVKAAAPDPSEDYVSPGPAHDELNERVVAHMKGNPALSYQQAFTREYTHPDNRSLKDRVDAEGILRAQAREPAPPFPAYARG